MPAERMGNESCSAMQGVVDASFTSATRMLECYAAGFGQWDVDGMEARKERAPTRVCVHADQLDELGGGALRTSIGEGGVIRLAPAIDEGSDRSGAARQYQASVAHALAHLRYSRPASPVGKRGALRIAVASLIEDARVERLLMRDYPGLHSLWGAFHAASGERGMLTFSSLAARLARALHDFSYEDPNEWVCKGRRLFDAIAAHHEDIAACHEVADILAVDLAQMRVRFDVSSYRAEPRYRDDNTYLWTIESEPVHARMEWAPDATDQTTARPNVVDSMRLLDNPPIETEAWRAYRYPEWHSRVGLLLLDWTCVYDRAPAAERERVDAGLLAVRQALPSGWQRPPRRLRRQSEGPELDLDAVIDDGIARRMGVAGDGRIFEQKRRTPPSMSVLFLLDLSTSTNDRIGVTQQTVLDIEKEAAATIASALEPTATRVALHGFSSNGRHDVRYTRVKDFDEPFGKAQRERLLAQKGTLSTRMGAALRHATAQFDGEQSEAKLLVLVTDGEPSDVDVHDSMHLIEDARDAVSALSSRGILPFCFAFDRDADRYVRTIFGHGHYLVLNGAGNLAQEVSKVLASLR
ncbi:nitric oxide reductase NorD protein [Paraburkholderia sp. WC7.3g]|uniref:VWA domain-containing protein n=2 Tax=Paraburkholderia TaxID=1822464 RepID=A0ABR7Q001_9BURK|nr:VWA domain-containing protein [Paraburkholderia podalyriae]